MVVFASNSVTPLTLRGFALKLCIRVWPLASLYLTVKVVPYIVK